MKTAATYREAYDYEPKRKPQGFYVDQMKAYAETEIEEKDSARMRCATYTHLISILNLIGEISNIREDRVYQALRMLGYNRCYHKMKLARGNDIFTDIERYVSICKVSGDTSKMLVAQKKLKSFVDVKIKQYRVAKPVHEVAIKQARKCGMDTSHLNLYHVLHGVKVLTENEPEYILMVEYPVIKNALERLNEVDKSLECHRAMLGAVAGL